VSIQPTEGEPLSRHTSLKAGGPADYFVLARSLDEIRAALAWGAERKLPTRVIGGGSNLLVSDAGVEGLVIKAGGTEFEVTAEGDDGVVRADSGVTFANLARRLAKEGWGALEWAANVPGTVGGAVVNNAGAFGGDTATSLVSATVVLPGGEVQRLLPADLSYAYRTSRLKRGELPGAAVVEAQFKVSRSTVEAATALVAELQAKRTASQPRLLSAGSVFANPPGTFSGKLIEEAGLKGTRIGGAEISAHHANFIVNPEHASAADVYGLIRLAQQTVFERTGTWLTPEIELFGRWTDTERRALKPL
jgi:UDP-N-acetylmuramate dehydrogenase